MKNLKEILKEKYEEVEQKIKNNNKDKIENLKKEMNNIKENIETLKNEKKEIDNLPEEYPLNKFNEINSKIKEEIKNLILRELTRTNDEEEYLALKDEGYLEEELLELKEKVEKENILENFNNLDEKLKEKLEDIYYIGIENKIKEIEKIINNQSKKLEYSKNIIEKKLEENKKLKQEKNKIREIMKDLKQKSSSVKKKILEIMNNKYDEEVINKLLENNTYKMGEMIIETKEIDKIKNDKKLIDLLKKYEYYISEAESENFAGSYSKKEEYEKLAKEKLEKIKEIINNKKYNVNIYYLYSKFQEGRGLKKLQTASKQEINYNLS